jgi:signal transduction histidine kinase
VKLVPRSLAGRLTLLLLLGLLVAQGAAFALFARERSEAVRHVYRETMVARTASVLSLLGETPPAMHDRVLKGASTRSLRFWLADEAAIAPSRARGPAAIVAADLADRLGLRPDRVRVALAPPRLRDDAREDDDDDDEHEHRGGHHERRGRWLALSVALPDGRWLNAVTGAPPRPPLGAPFLVSLVLSAAAVAGIAVLAARRLAGPMRRLALAADRLGRGEAVAALSEEGPEEVRRSIQAFNRMRERLDRFVRDRTAMLAAISHDLRTPITSLRLRAEFVDDEETRSRILDTLDEMQGMTEATLAFAREEAADEETRTVDLAALVDSVVADLAEVGHAVAFAGAERTLIACRPGALRRALANLVVNAATYGKRATVRLERDPGELRVVIEDEGPGIPGRERERVFEPFVRLEPSRSRATGGIGLGLAIARTIVRNHGGDIVLENRAERGLRATVHLPHAAA